MSDQSKANGLAAEKSPYLLKHAHNPVDWHPWNERTLAKARNDGKPIFLSIGYFSCHWCSVMERESFEDVATAAILNRHFIPVKVDREERPELDAYYMKAVQAMTGQGGWPLSVFLTPELKPFYGGTYFPPEPRYGMPSFRQVLEFVAKLWKEKRSEVEGNAAQVARAMLRETASVGGDLPPGAADEAYAALASSFDPEHGGFGTAPKFPLPTALQFMLFYNFRTGKELALKTVTKTLDEIAAGGIRDHVGGGFHRYSTDRSWLVPHFEKMLYDNALIAEAFLDAYLVTRAERYREAVLETLGWMTEELAAPEGGFYSAQDADTAEGEGAYYTWTQEEVEKELGAKASEAFCYVYGVTREGNFEGRRSIPHRVRTTDEAAHKFGVESRELALQLSEWKGQLARARRGRARPAIDTKVLTGWNGLAIATLAKAGRALGVQRFIDAAKGAAEFVLARSVRDGELLRSFAAGESRIQGTLEDYAFFIGGLLALFEATNEPRWLERSVSIAKKMIEKLFDEARGGFFMSAIGAPERLKDDYDGPMPSGNSAALLDLVRLAELTGMREFRDRADRTLKCFASDIGERPAEHAVMLMASDMLTRGMREIVVTALEESAAVMMAEVTKERYLPDTVLLISTSETHAQLSRLSTLLDGRSPGREPVAYVCRDSACGLPAKSAVELAQQLLPSRG